MGGWDVCVYAWWWKWWGGGGVGGGGGWGVFCVCVCVCLCVWVCVGGGVQASRVCDSCAAQLTPAARCLLPSLQAITELIARISSVQEAFERQRAAVATDLSRLQADIEAHEAEMAAPLPELPPGAEGAPAVLEAASADMRTLEAALAAAAAEEARLQGLLAADREEVEVLRTHLTELEAAAAAEGEKVEVNGRFVAAGEWADQMAVVLTQLAGVSLLHAAPDGRALALKLLTSYPIAGVATPDGDPGPCATGDHELSIELDRPGGTVASAALHPADVDIGEAVEAARAARARPAFLVTEVQAQLGGLLHFRALAAEAGEHFELVAQVRSARGGRAHAHAHACAPARPAQLPPPCILLAAGTL